MTSLREQIAQRKAAKQFAANLKAEKTRLEAAKRKRSVLLIDHNRTLASKIIISGGGKCNFTNLNIHPDCYISQNPHFCKSALAKYTQYDFINLLNTHNISYHEKTLGQLFLDHKANILVELFEYLCKLHNVTIKLDTKIINVTHDTDFIVDTVSNTTQYELYNKENPHDREDYNQYIATKLVVATGGLSIPQIGASNFGYQLAKQFELKIETTFPALVPLSLKDEFIEIFKELSGISFMSHVSLMQDANNLKHDYKKIKFREKTLLTHRGLSGPAILQISSYWQQNDAIIINTIPDLNITEEINKNKHSKLANKLFSNFLAQFLSQRLSDALCSIINIDKPLCHLKNAEINKIHNVLHNLTIYPNGTLGYKKAEVTKGGISCDELSSKSLMTHKVTGLYFIGELVDVTGHLGGYNFQWAWSSGYSAGIDI